MLRVTTAISVVFASQLVTGAAGAGQAPATAPEVRLGDLAAAAGWRAGDFQLPSSASADLDVLVGMGWVSPGRATAALGMPPAFQAGTTGDWGRGASAPTQDHPYDAASIDCSIPVHDDWCESWMTSSSSTAASAPVAYDRAWDAELSPDGAVAFITGGTSDGVGGRTVAVRTDTGAVLWESRFPGEGLAIAASPDGNKVFVAGTLPGWTGATTAAYDALSGDLLWMSPFKGPASSYERPFAVEVTPDNSTVVVGGQAVTGSAAGLNNNLGYPANHDSIVVAYSTATGDPRWTDVSEGPGYEFATDLALDDAHVYVLRYGSSAPASQLFAHASNYHAVTVAHDVVTGARLWSAAFTRGRSETPWRIAVDAAHARVYSTSVSASPETQGTDYLTVAHDAASGEELWRAVFGGDYADGIDIPTAIAVDDRCQRLIVTGLASNARFGDYDFGTVAYDGRSGEELWVSRYAGNGNGDDRPWDLVLSPDGSRAYVTGRAGPTYGGGFSGGTAMPAATIALDAATGSSRRIARFEGIEATQMVASDPEAINVTPDGSRVVVAGRVMSASGGAASVNPADFVGLGYGDDPLPGAPSPTCDGSS